MAVFRRYRGDPFPETGVDAGANSAPEVFDHEAYGAHYQEALRKFILRPLGGKPIPEASFSALWSEAMDDPEARGFGKTLLMRQLTKNINEDFGNNILQEMGKPPSAKLLACYATFEQGGDAKNLNVLGHKLVWHFANGKRSDGTPLCEIFWRELFEAARCRGEVNGEPNDDDAGDALYSAFERFCNRGGLSAHEGKQGELLLVFFRRNQEQLVEFLRNAVHQWHQTRSGWYSFRTLMALAIFGGFQRVYAFIDEVQNLTMVARGSRLALEAGRMRGLLAEDSVSRRIGSYILTMHPRGWQDFSMWWVAQENLPDLANKVTANDARVITLRGLNNIKDAKHLASVYIDRHEPNDFDDEVVLHEEALEVAYEESRKIPRSFLRALSIISQRALNQYEEADEPLAREALLGFNPHEPGERSDTPEGEIHDLWR